ncbi:hypothetical protein KSP39_PZI013773 [Platanthera zijinensis]|uniref:FCP1 homology domain-containing protein n=1 Tax=Platanthera zijinensis TaxID=2320716 RepID=A0AAP0BDW2_9ASPA
MVAAGDTLLTAANAGDTPMMASSIDTLLTAATAETPLLMGASIEAPLREAAVDAKLGAPTVEAGLRAADIDAPTAAAIDAGMMAVGIDAGLTAAAIDARLTAAANDARRLTAAANDALLTAAAIEARLKAAAGDTPLISPSIDDQLMAPSNEALLMPPSINTPLMASTGDTPLMSGDTTLMTAVSETPVIASTEDAMLMLMDTARGTPLMATAGDAPLMNAAVETLLTAAVDTQEIGHSYETLSILPPPLNTSPLPPPSNPRRKTVFLDLDRTLVYSKKGNPPPENYDFTVNFAAQNPLLQDETPKTYFVIKRPGVDEFLRAAAKHFELVIFTAAMEQYAAAVIEKLDPGGEMIAHRLYRDSCCALHGKRFVKNLFGIGREEEKVIIIDDQRISFALQRRNGILVTPFRGDPGDLELRRVMEFLDVARYFKDTRVAVKLYGSRAMAKLGSYMMESSRLGKSMNLMDISRRSMGSPEQM